MLETPDFYDFLVTFHQIVPNSICILDSFLANYFVFELVLLLTIWIRNSTLWHRIEGLLASQGTPKLIGEWGLFSPVDLA